MSRLVLKEVEGERRLLRLNSGLESLLWKLVENALLPSEDFDELLHCPEQFVTAVAVDGCRVPVHLDCGKPSCPTHAYVKHMTSWMKAVEDIFRLYQASGIRVAVKRVVVTVPDYLRDVVYAMPERKFRAMLVRVLERCFSVGGRYQLCYMIANHFWSTTDPFSGPKPHLDCNLFNIVYDRLTGRYVSLDLFVSAGVFRKCWFEEMSAIEGFHSKDVDVRLEEPRRGWSHVAQAVKYSTRPPMEDVLKYLKDNPVPEGVGLDFVADLLVGRSKRQSYVWGGIFSNAVRKRTQDDLDFRLRSRKVFEKELKALYCEHGKLLERDYFSVPVGVEEIQRQGLRFVRWLDDPPIWEVSLH